MCLFHSNSKYFSSSDRKISSKIYLVIVLKDQLVDIWLQFFLPNRINGKERDRVFYCDGSETLNSKKIQTTTNNFKCLNDRHLSNETELNENIFERIV